MGSSLVLPFLSIFASVVGAGQHYRAVVPAGGWGAPVGELSTPGRWGERRTNPIDGTVFVWVPAGPFLFGPKNERLYCGGFWMARSVVTEKQFRVFCRATGFVPFAERTGKYPRKKMLLKRPTNTENFAETDVDFDAAAAYAKWAHCAIPTEEMWEKAARGTDGRKYPWGNGLSKRSRDRTSPYGCLGMVDSVAQWTSSGGLAHPARGMGAYVEGLTPHQIVKGFSDCIAHELVDAHLSPLFGFRLAVIVGGELR